MGVSCTQCEGWGDLGFFVWVLFGGGGWGQGCVSLSFFVPNVVQLRSHQVPKSVSCLLGTHRPSFMMMRSWLLLVWPNRTGKGMLQKRFFLCGRDPPQKLERTRNNFCSTAIKVNSHSSCCLCQYISRLPTQSFINERLVSIFCLNLLQVFKGMAFALKYLANLWSHESNRLGHSSCCQNLCLNFDCVSLCSYKFGDAE
jgi:hypothetical protein